MQPLKASIICMGGLAGNLSKQSQYQDNGEMMPETTSAVLDRVADQMQDMAEAIDKAEANQRKR